MSLYLKYRPESWEDIFGNEETIQSVQNMLKKKNPPHSYLLTGGTGCGKTTIARIMAKELGCVGSDFKEMNAANVRGIEGIREIIANCKYKPMEGVCRVWMVDECHKLTKDAQNAFLKILEDTPDHVFFILATTDPQTLLTTVKGRCMAFDMNPLSDREMLKLLVKITRAEDDKVERDIYEQIIEDTQGHPRNAIQVLEKVLNTEPENRLEIAKKMAEQVNESIELCRILLSGGSWKKVAGILVGLKQQEPESIRRVVLGYCSSVLLKSGNAKAAMIIEYFEEPLYNIGFPGLVKNCFAIIKD